MADWQHTVTVKSRGPAHKQWDALRRAVAKELQVTIDHVACGFAGPDHFRVWVDSSLSASVVEKVVHDALSAVKS